LTIFQFYNIIKEKIVIKRWFKVLPEVLSRPKRIKQIANAVIVFIVGILFYQYISFLFGHSSSLLNIVFIVPLWIEAITFSITFFFVWLMLVGLILQSYNKETIIENAKYLIAPSIIFGISYFILDMNLIFSALMPNALIFYVGIKRKKKFIKLILYMLIYNILTIILQFVLYQVHLDILIFNMSDIIFSHRLLLAIIDLVIIATIYLRGVIYYADNALQSLVSTDFEFSQDDVEIQRLIQEINQTSFLRKLAVRLTWISINIIQNIVIFAVIYFLSSSLFITIILTSSFAICSFIIYYKWHSSTFLRCTLISISISSLIAVFFANTWFYYLPYVIVLISAAIAIGFNKLVVLTNKCKSMEQCIQLIKEFQIDGKYYNIHNFLEVAKNKMPEAHIKALGLDTIAYTWYRQVAHEMEKKEIELEDIKKREHPYN